jgi:hypothetical protein
VSMGQSASVMILASGQGKRQRTAIKAVSDPGGSPGAGAGADLLSDWAKRTSPQAGERVHASLRFAFYGPVSTEDWQDPVTSRARQRDQASALVAGHGTIVAEFFDAGESRTLAARITRALNDAGIPCSSAADPARNPRLTR